MYNKELTVKQLDLPEYKQELDTAVNYLNSLSKYSAVKTKFNNKEKLSKPEQVSLFPPFYKNIHLPS